MRGYLGNPEATAEAFAGAGFTPATSDTVTRRASTSSSIARKELIIRGRYNLYPRDVEEVKAYVETAPGTTATEQELIAYVETHVAAYKYPRTVEFRAELPKGPAGKTLKKGLESRLP